MFAKSLLTAAVVATAFAVLPAQQAAAHTQVGIGVGFGYGGGPGYGGYPGYGYGGYGDGDYYDAGYGGISCWKGKEILRWQGFKNVQPYDCSPTVYKYKAWKYGTPYRVRVNWQGYITSVRPF